MITLHFNNTTLDIQEDDNSYRYRSLMGEHNLTLKFHLTEYVEISIGAWCEFMAIRYTLEAPANIKKNGTREIEYTLIMESAQNQLGRYKLRNTVDKRLKFSMCATPKEFLQTIVDNLNMRDSGWSVGECIVSTEKTIPFDHSFIDEALQSLADKFETEWEIVGKVIHLRKVEYFKDDPLPLSYGKGNGFVPGVGRSTEADSRPVEILFVQGGSQNIDRSKYGSAELLLPKSQTLVYEGRTYISDAEGYSIKRQDKPIKYNNEDSLDCSEIYPSRVGTVSKVTVVDMANNFYDIIDNSIPENLNYNDYLIEGESMTVIFQSGMLSGDDKAFECKYNHSERKFELVPQEIDGLTMPGDVYIPRVGDTYAVFGCMLPDAYVCDNATKTGASWDMFKEAARYMYENEDVKFTFTGELQGLWAKRNWLRIGGRMVVGSYILFSDKQFAPDGISIRITGIKEYLTAPYSPTIELSNSVSGKSVSSTLKEIQNNDVIVEDNQKKIIQYTKRRFRDSLETIQMLEQAMLDNFTNSISPIAVQTMAMLVGDESLQFRFVNSSLTPIEYNIEYNQTTKQLTAPATILQHMTLGINTITSSRDKNSYKRWSMSKYVSPVLSDGSKKYYLYAKVPVSGAGSGDFILDEKSIKMTDVSGYYHLLVGILNTEYDGERSFVSLYGFTEVLPGQITTDKIISSDGNNFMDFVNNTFRIGNSDTYIDWNAAIKNALSMRNATIQITNTSGQTMIYFNGVDGSGQLAKGNITWDSNGNLTAHSGTFENVIIKGAMRTPFQNGYFRLSGTDSDGIIVSTLGLQNNNCVVIPGVSKGLYTAFKIPFTSEYNGFRACIINAKWGNDNAVGQIMATSPNGYYFHEDGEQIDNLVINPNEGVDIIGVGEGDSFKGWLIMNRFRYGISNSGEGFPLKALFAGKVEFSNGTPRLVKQRRYNQYWYGAENKVCQLSYPIKSPHYCTINFPTGTFSSADNYTVLLTGEKLLDSNDAGVYASVIKRTANSFTVYTGDDASWNDGNFTFIVIPTHLWN